jgi:uncharacterized membrane protein HdeD (DUF308 family)
MAVGLGGPVPGRVLGLTILAQSPASGLWVIGLFLGISLIFSGLA